MAWAMDTCRTAGHTHFCQHRYTIWSIPLPSRTPHEIKNDFQSIQVFQSRCLDCEPFEKATLSVVGVYSKLFTSENTFSGGTMTYIQTHYQGLYYQGLGNFSSIKATNAWISVLLRDSRCKIIKCIYAPYAL